MLHSLKLKVLDALRSGEWYIDLSRAISLPHQNQQDPNCCADSQFLGKAHNLIKDYYENQRWRRSRLLFSPKILQNPGALSLERLINPDIQKWLKQIQKFVADWSLENKDPLSEGALEDFSKKILSFPDYFLQNLNYYISKDPLLAKAMIIQVDILPAESLIREDESTDKALRQTGKDRYTGKKLQEISDQILYLYEFLGAAFFPKQFKNLKPEERQAFKEKISKLPAKFVEMFIDSNLGYAQFLFMAHFLGLSSLGIPTSSKAPTTES